MPKQPRLRRLLNRQQMEAWLNSFLGLDGDLVLAIVEAAGRPGGRLLTQAGRWDEHLLATLADSIPPEIDGGLLRSEDSYYYPLFAEGLLVGTLVVRGGSDETSRSVAAPVAAAVAVAVGEGLNLMIGEAVERRGIADEALDRYRELSLLYRVAESIGATLDPSKILTLLLEEGQRLIDASIGLILLKEVDSGWKTAANFGAAGSDEALQPLLEQIVGEVANWHGPLIITEFPNSAPDKMALVPGSLLWAPLSTADKMLGGVLLGRSIDRPIFVANDLKLLTALAGQAAIALDKANLFEQTETYAHQLQELNTIGKELSAMLELEPLLEQILRAAIELTNSEEGAFFLIDESTGELVFTVVEGGPEELIGVRLPAGQGIAGRAAATGEPQIVNDVQDNHFWYDEIDTMRGFTTRSILAIPLIKQEEPIGVLEVINHREGRPYRQQEVDLLLALASQAAVALETARLHQEALAKQRMERELLLGHEMQSSLMPSSIPVMAGWEFAAWWEPAREVSGDYYDFVQLGEELGIVMADVADKGVHAALFMALTRSTVRTSLHALRQPAASISEANRLIAQDATRGMFVTLCYAQFRPSSDDVTYVNAGHNPPYWYRAADDCITELEPTGIFLGLNSGIPFEEQAIHCSPGDFIVLYTDGITEAMNAERVQFGEERFQAELLRYRDRSPDEMLQHVQQALREHTGDTPQSDDITLVIARRK